MKNLSTKAIILGHRTHGEHDKVLFLYTQKMGKLHVTAKGSRKITSKFTGHLETLSTLQTELYFGPRNIILTEVQPLSPAHLIEKDSYLTAMQIAEITHQLVYEEQEIEGLFSLLEDTRKELSHNINPLITLASYIIRILDLTGLLPDFREHLSSEKYHRFFECLKTKSLREVPKIALKKEEIHYLTHYLSELLTRETGRTWKLVTL